MYFPCLGCNNKRKVLGKLQSLDGYQGVHVKVLVSPGYSWRPYGNVYKIFPVIASPKAECNAKMSTSSSKMMPVCFRFKALGSLSYIYETQMVPT